MMIGAAVVVGVGALIGVLASGKDKPAPAASAPDTTLSAVAPTAAAAPAPVAPVAPVAVAPVAAAAAPTGLAGAGAVPTAGAAAPAPTEGAPTEGAAAAPTQDEKVLGKVALAGAAKIKGGKLRPKDVAEALTAQLPALERCYTETLEDKPSAQGELTFGFTVGKTGKPTAVKKLSGTLKDAALARCAVDALGDARFDKLKKPAKVTVPLRFAKR
jgi:hypothetical protein